MTQCTDPGDYLNNAVSGQDSDFMAGTVVALLGVQNLHYCHMGSGTLVDIEGTHFIATCGHFEFEPPMRGPFLIRGGDRFQPIPPSQTQDSDILDMSFKNNNGYDLGAIELCKDHTVPGWALGLDRFKRIPNPATQSFMVQGYPSEKNEARQTGMMVKGDIVMSTLQLGWLQKDRHGYKFDYRETGLGDCGQTIRYPSPRGLSGGPIWHVDDMRAWQQDPPGLTTIDTRTYPRPLITRKGYGVSLYAIQSSWIELKREAYGVCALEWLRFVADWKPHLAEPINKVLLAQSP